MIATESGNPAVPPSFEPDRPLADRLADYERLLEIGV